jgi:phytoene dehydrogenase-like protein
VVQAMLGMNEAGYDYWRELYRDRAAYREKKAEIAGNIQRLIEERFPAYAGALRLLDTWTPMTYQRYCNAYKGYNQSFTITKASAKGAATPEPWIPGLSNVILCGQWMNMPGGVPSAAISGKFAIQRILRREGEG